MNIPPRFLPCLMLAAATAVGMQAQTTSTITLANNTPGFVKTATNLGPADPTKPMNVTLALTSKDSAALDQFVNDVRTEGSGSYHQFITPAQFTQQFGATTETIAAVKKFAAANGLQVVGVAANNLAMTLRGPVGAIESAFSVRIDNFKQNGAVLRANANDPKIAANLAASVSGVSASDVYATPDLVLASTPNGKPLKPAPLSVSSDGLFFSNQCFRSPESITASGGGATATYVGNRYGANITNTKLGTLPPCGYDVADVWGGYDLKPMYEAGLKGEGESIVIIDAYGSSTIEADANTFSQLNNLPTLTSSNFKMVGKPVATTSNWPTETTLDVEWAHAIAPAAKIVLEIAASNSFTDLYNAEADAITHHRGVVLSNSWSTLESDTDPGLRSTWDSLLKEAISIGINVDFSTGDYGDNVVVTKSYADVGYPASSPYATAIGGTSLALTASQTMKFQTGWGNNATYLVNGANGDPLDPPTEFGFQYGATGGNSNVYGKPSWQKGTDQPRRAIPDVSWLADPFTGVEIVQTISGTQYIEVIGGTSLACPMFSGIWAVANQKANTTIGLGDAASQLYSLPSGAVDDVVPFNTTNNVHGVIKDSGGTYQETSTELAAPLDYTRGFYSALYQDPNNASWYVLTFGTDSTLYTKQGWDDVTGVGTPNGEKFVTAIANKK